jgi:hypothetical protein
MPGESDAVRQGLPALSGGSSTLKSISRQRARNPIDSIVMSLEALGWVPRKTHLDPTRPMDPTAQILQPDCLTPRMFAEAASRVRANRPVADRRRSRRWTARERLSGQTIGPFADQARTLQMMEQFSAERAWPIVPRIMRPVSAIQCAPSGRTCALRCAVLSNAQANPSSLHAPGTGWGSRVPSRASG